MLQLKLLVFISADVNGNIDEKFKVRKKVSTWYLTCCSNALISSAFAARVFFEENGGKIRVFL